MNPPTPELYPYPTMNAINLRTGEDADFDLTEGDYQLFTALMELSPNGADLRFVLEADEIELFESRFEGEHVSSFMYEFRREIEADESLTYREATEEGEAFAFVTYFKTD